MAWLLSSAKECMACKTANTRKIVVMAEHGQKSPHKTDTDTHHGAALLHVSCTMSVTVFGASAATIYQPRKLSYAACYRTGQQKTEKWTYDVCFFLESFLIVLLSGHLVTSRPSLCAEKDHHQRTRTEHIFTAYGAQKKISHFFPAVTGPDSPQDRQHASC